MGNVPAWLFDVSQIIVITITTVLAVHISAVNLTLYKKAIYGVKKLTWRGETTGKSRAFVSLSLFAAFVQVATIAIAAAVIWGAAVVPVHILVVYAVVYMYARFG